MRIYLIGFMGCGKSTAGKTLAKKMGFDFIDLDTLIENRFKISIPQLFDKYDENALYINCFSLKEPTVHIFPPMLQIMYGFG